MKTMYNIPFMAALILITACSPQARLTRLLARHPELTLSDTLTIRDTIVVMPIEADTVISLAELRDTVYLRNEQLEIALQSTANTLFVKGKCKADTVYRTHRITVERIKVIKPDRLDAFIAKIPWLVVGLIVVAVLIALVLFRKKINAL
ncbi:MAG: hypothetical protein ACOYNU_11290 [Bacteroidales bacterium]